MKHFLLSAGICLLMAACSKNTEPGKGVDTRAELPGTIYYKWANEGVYAWSGQSGNRAQLLKDQTRRNGWDVSKNNQLILESLDQGGMKDATRFVITNKKHGSIVSEFEFADAEGSYLNGTLSPDGKKVAIKSSLPGPIFITDLKGKLLEALETVGGDAIEGTPVWMPDNTLLFKHKKYLLRTDAAFSQATVVKEMDFADWGAYSVSNNGKKISFTAGEHIWIMNADGSDLKQVTTSNSAERYSHFSPDDRYLVVGTHHKTTGLFGAIIYLKVVPADGKQYHVEDGSESKGVIPVRQDDEKQTETADGAILWR